MATRVQVECSQCSKMFEAIASQIEYQKAKGRLTFFCSRTCSGKSKRNFERARVIKPRITKQCPKCLALFEVKDTKGSRSFCSRACANSKQNSGPRESDPRQCRICKSPVKGLRRHYCSMTCQVEGLRLQFEAGELQARSTLHKFLALMKPGCHDCGLTDWRGSKLSLEVDHIDGDASNNLPNNLRLVCPNCHSITPTWKGRNKGSGRKSRGLDLS